MYREISHTADVAYEIEFEDVEGLFSDIAQILRENTEYVLKGEKRRESYEVSEELEDSIFDIGNEMIYMIDSGWVPLGVKFIDGELEVEYVSANVTRFPFKALTYHMLNVENLGDKKKVKVVFDV